MALAQREQDPPLTHERVAAALRCSPRPDFLTLVALLERLRPHGSPRVGHSAGDHPDFIRFRHDPSPRFPTADVVAVATTPERVTLLTNFLGLVGARSPLPDDFTAAILDEPRPVRRDLLDIFHDRLLALLFRLLRAQDLHADHHHDASDPWSARVLALTGCDREASPDPALPHGLRLALAPLFAARPDSAAALEAALRLALAPDLGDAHVTLEPCIEALAELARDDRSRLGHSRHELGRSLLLGGLLRDRAGAFRIHIGPLDAHHARGFLRGGPALPRLRAVLHALAPPQLRCELAVALRPDAAPPLLLTFDPARATSLGTNTWLRSGDDRELRLLLPLDL